MKTLSTGHDSTLKNYKKLAATKGPKAVAYIQKKIDCAPNGENEEVVADESQMLYMLQQIEFKGFDPDEH